MATFRSGEVIEILGERAGLQRLAVRLPEGDARAYSLTALTGSCSVGDRVVLNTTAVDLALGTGGWHIVHWNLELDELHVPGPDHVMKLRYTSLQFDAGTSELANPSCDDPLGGAPVVACSVHSQVPVVAAAFADAAPDRRLVYVMTDGAALPLALSDLVVELTEHGLLAGTVTAGNAFGGDLEAVGVPSALGLAVHALHADAVVVGMGPGVVGTGTRSGTTALEAAPVLDAAELLGGTPVLCVRASSGDERGRHLGISHHTESICRLTRARPFVAPVPPEVVALPGVRVVEPTEQPEPAELLSRHGLRVTTMGRTVEQDPTFFASAAAAGHLCAQLLP